MIVNEVYKLKEATEVAYLENLKKAFKNRDYNGPKNPFYGCGDKIKGEKNPMYGKTFYDVWVDKYGKEIADLKMEEWKQKRKKKKN